LEKKSTANSGLKGSENSSELLILMCRTYSLSYRRSEQGSGLPKNSSTCLDKRHDGKRSIMLS
jgi:hypothetical protein